MIAKLAFNLPEEQSEFEDMLDGPKLKGAVQEFDNHLRSILKWSTDKSEEYIQAVQDVRDKLFDIVTGAGLGIWD